MEYTRGQLYILLATNTDQPFVNMHTKASSQSSVVSKIYTNDCFYCLNSEQGWMHIQSGWNTGYIQVDSIQLISVSDDHDLAVVAGKPTNVRNREGKIVGSLNQSGELAYIGRNPFGVQNFLSYVPLLNGIAKKRQWISADYITQHTCLFNAITVPHQSQKSNKYINDCGQASVRMLALYKKGTAPSLDEIVQRTFTQNRLTGAQDLQQMGKLCGIELQVDRANLFNICSQLDSGNPLIALVTYGKLSNRAHPYTGGHWLVVTGYSQSVFYLNDPLRDSSQWAVPFNEFILSLQNTILY